MEGEPKDPNGVETGNMPYEISEERRQVYFSGSREEIMQLVAKFSAKVHSSDAEKNQLYEKTFYEQNEEYADEKLGEYERSRGSKMALEITPQPFRFYVYPEPRRFRFAPLSDSRIDQLGINQENRRWAALLLENNIPDDEKRKAEQWEQLKNLFLEIRENLESA